MSDRIEHDRSRQYVHRFAQENNLPLFKYELSHSDSYPAGARSGKPIFLTDNARDTKKSEFSKSGRRVLPKDWKMTPKQQRLVRDLATLFVKYDLKDWDIVLRELRDSKSMERVGLANLIEELVNVPVSAAARRKPVKVSVRGKRKVVPLPQQLAAFKTAIGNRELLASQAELRDFAVSLGYKENLPTNRQDAIDRVVSFLSGKPNAAVQEILKRADKPSRVKADFQ